MENACKFPALPERYDRALREAVSFVLQRFKPVGIIAAGTIVRGTPDATSDLDLWVVHLEPMRQRLQKFFNGVPAEIFVNPSWVIRKYFTQDQADARPISAHMMATGAVVLATDPVVEELRQTAMSLLNSPSTVTEEKLTSARYAAATKLEDGLDIVDRNPTSAVMLASDAVHQMLRFAFMKERRFIPRDKDLLKALADLNPELAVIAHSFFQSGEPRARLHFATELADRVLHARGFFEWESDAEEVPL